MNWIIKNQKIAFFSSGIILAGIISIGFFMQSCSQINDFPELSVYESEKSLNLVAPNGEKIASNISNLKEIVSVSVAEKFGLDKEFHITNLEYAPVKKGYAVLIKYETIDGIKGGLIRTNDLSPNVSPDLKVRMIHGVRLKAGGENTAKLNSITITCQDLGDCTCIPTFTTEGSTVHYSCGDCDNCEMTLTSD